MSERRVTIRNLRRSLRPLIENARRAITLTTAREAEILGGRDTEDLTDHEFAKIEDLQTEESQLADVVDNLETALDILENI